MTLSAGVGLRGIPLMLRIRRAHLRRPADDDDMDRRTGSGLPRSHSGPSSARRVRAAGHYRHAPRRGVGVRWSDVDLTVGPASISQTVIMVHHDIQIGAPKTARGRRTVALDPGTITVLREHRQRQIAERLLMGAGFTDHGLVFCRPDGGPLHPERFSRTFSRESAHAGLPAIRLHDLRHTWATLALSAGEHPKVVQERLGHANVSITLDVYSHVSEGLHGDAASRLTLIFAR